MALTQLVDKMDLLHYTANKLQSKAFKNQKFGWISAKKCNSMLIVNNCE